MLRRALVALVVLSVLGCGGEASDLLAIDRAGTGPGARLRVVVSDDGLARCNGAAARRLPGPLLIEARELERDIREAAVAGTVLGPRPQSVLRYRVQTQAGRLRFADNSLGAPPTFLRAAFLVRRIAKEVCGLAR